MLPQEKNKPRIIVVGYYNHANLGDEQYKETFQYVIDNYLSTFTNTTVFVDCDKFKNFILFETDVIILGGGDVLNYYFLDQIHAKLSGKPNKLLAVSVGLPYADILTNTDILGIIDYIFIRTQQDMNFLLQYFAPERIFYLPDISFFLREIRVPKITNNPSADNILQEAIYNRALSDVIELIKVQTKKRIVVSLSRHFYSKSSPEYYTQIINQLVQFYKKILKSGEYYIVFVPFNTSTEIANPICNQENDLLFQSDICKLLLYNSNNTTNHHNYNRRLEPHIYFIEHTLTFFIEDTLTSAQMLDIYKNAFISIPMRFHACLYSIYMNTPLLPIYTTKKIKNLLLDIEWDSELQYSTPKNAKDIPTEINADILWTKFQSLAQTQSEKKKHLSNMCETLFASHLSLSIPNLVNIITNDYPKKKTVEDPNKKIDDLFQRLQNIAKENGKDDFRQIKDHDLQNMMVSIVNYFLVNGKFDSIYSHGLQEKMFLPNFNYREEWKWIVKDCLSKQIQIQDQTQQPLQKQPIKQNDGRVNLQYIDQSDDSGSHRSGWQYVYENIQHFHNKDSPIYMDLYLDRSFHWQKQIMKYIGLIPYTKPWVGFIHHTFDTSFSKYNADAMFKDPDFISSLSKCKCLFVLSNYLRKQVMDILQQIGFKKIPVHALTHPTEIIDDKVKWSLELFEKNADKKIVHVGGWLRNLYFFYWMTIPPEINMCKKLSFGNVRKYISNWFSSNKDAKNDSVSCGIRKVALKGKNMNNYYPLEFSESFTRNKKKEENKKEENKKEEEKEGDEKEKKCSQNSQENTNNWMKHFGEHWQYKMNSVEVINTLSNQEYDTLLSENIVFINLVDASTVNTVLECIVRNTPIIVNKHPAVVELLGESYPLYYDHYKETCLYYEMDKNPFNKLFNMRKIKQAHNYLKQMNKDRFSIESFVATLGHFL